MHIAIDTGGTFTDCVYLEADELKVLKLFSTPDSVGDAVVKAVRSVISTGAANVRLGTTVATNLLLERKGARVAFITTAGFEDIIAIGRQARSNLYDWFFTPAPCIVPRELRFGVSERTAADGTLLKSPSESELDALRERVRGSGAESIAISLLFSFANPEHELRVARALQPLALPVSLSHVILPEFREYERASTLVVNAYVAPRISSYLGEIESRLQAVSPDFRFHVIQSSGGIIPARLAAEQPVRTVLSGPAGGVVGAFRMARLAGFDRIISFDMGGTSTDVALVDEREGGPKITNESIISQMPVSVPMLEIHTVGAGGGSIARFDEAGILHVGPQSAGAKPGPICYGTGTEPTVTDANLVLGRLDRDHFLGGAVRLDLDRAHRYMDRTRNLMTSVEQFAGGILMVAESAMEKAIRLVSVERGHDPRDFTLVAFGGAGPLHACALAKALRIPHVLVPCMPGALSALGILLADAVRDFSQTVMKAADPHVLEDHFQQLEERGLAQFAAEGMTGHCTRSADLRYAGQGYELNVDAEGDMLVNFHNAHQRRYGYSDQHRKVEVVNIRARIAAAAEPVNLLPGTPHSGNGKHAVLQKRPVVFESVAMETPIYDRDKLAAGDRFSGPAIVVEYSATTVIPPSCTASIDAFRNIIIEIKG